MKRVNRAAFRKAICGGLLDGCEVLHGAHGCAWVRNGRQVAARHDILFLHTFYLGE
jgi:hypothetical protein